MSVRTTARRIRSALPSRHAAEVAALFATGVIALFMLGFVVLYWLQDAPGFAVAYEGYRELGRGMDAAFGTNVFSFPFMWQSMATGVFIGVVAPLVGSFLVHRQMALIGETLAHTAFAGVAFGFLFVGMFGFGGHPLFAALVVSTVGALGVNWLTKHTDAYGDVPIAIVLSGSFAIATLVITYGRGRTGIDIEGYLFGDIAIVTAGSARLMALLTVFVVGVVVWFYKELVFTTFDEQAARVARLDVDRYNALLVVVTAVVVVGSMQILGVILVAGMLVIPVAAASQVARSFRETVYLSIIFGQASVAAGFAFSVSAGMPSGGSIIVMTIIIYSAAVLVPIVRSRLPFLSETASG